MSEPLPVLRLTTTSRYIWLLRKAHFQSCTCKLGQKNMCITLIFLHTWLCYYISCHISRLSHDNPYKSMVMRRHLHDFTKVQTDETLAHVSIFLCVKYTVSYMFLLEAQAPGFNYTDTDGWFKSSRPEVTVQFWIFRLDWHGQLCLNSSVCLDQFCTLVHLQSVLQTLFSSFTTSS